MNAVTHPRVVPDHRALHPSVSLDNDLGSPAPRAVGYQLDRPTSSPSEPHRIDESRGTDEEGHRSPAKPLPDSIVVRLWADPYFDSAGFEARSDYVERFWLPTLGPTATWLLRRFARGLDRHPSGVRIRTEDTSRSIGLGGGLGKTAPFARGLDRLCAFGLARWLGHGELACRTYLLPLNERQLRRLPASLANAHAQHLATYADAHATSRSMALAECLVRLGDDSSEVARTLNVWGFEPTVAHAAADVARLGLAAGQSVEP